MFLPRNRRLSVKVGLWREQVKNVKDLAPELRAVVLGGRVDDINASVFAKREHLPILQTYFGPVLKEKQPCGER
jgi:hypothetical protein